MGTDSWFGIACVALAGGLASIAAPRAGLAQEDEVPSVVAPMDIRLDNVTLPPGAAERMNEYLPSCIAGENYLVVPRDQVARALVAQKVKAQDPCYGSCQVSIADAVAANKVLQSRMMKVGKECFVILDLYDVGSVTLERSAKVKAISCDESGLMAGLESAGAQLRGLQPGQSNQVVGQTLPLSLPPAPEVSTAEQSLNNSPPPAVKAETGYLYVQGEPKGARVDISGPQGFGDYGRVATSLPVAPFQVPAGQYSIKVSMTGYDQEEVRVRVYADATEGAKVNLIKSTGQIQISGKPEGAKSRLECQKGFFQDFGLPATPWTVTVPRGQCRLFVTRDGYAGYDQRFVVEGGGIVRQTVELERQAQAGLHVGPGNDADALLEQLQAGKPGLTRSPGELPERISVSQVMAGFNAKKGAMADCVHGSGEPVPFSAKSTVEFEGSGRVVSVKIVGGGSAKGCLESVLRSVRFERFSGPNMRVPYTINVR